MQPDELRQRVANINEEVARLGVYKDAVETMSVEDVIVSICLCYCIRVKLT